MRLRAARIREILYAVYTFGWDDALHREAISVTEQFRLAECGYIEEQKDTGTYHLSDTGRKIALANRL